MRVAAGVCANPSNTHTYTGTRTHAETKRD